MSTPEERLKRQADQLESEHTIRNQREQEEAAKQRIDSQRRTQEASTEAQTWLSRAETLVAATGKRVPVFLTKIADPPGFKLSIGASWIRAALRDDGWHVVETMPTDLHPKSGLAVGDFARLREVLLERMMQQGLKDLYEGRVSPAPDKYARG